MISTSTTVASPEPSPEPTSAPGQCRAGAASPRVLLLSCDQRPVAVLSRRAALRLLVSGRAVAAGAPHEHVRSSSGPVPLCPVIQLTRPVPNRPPGQVAFSKKAVLRRDRYRCAYCAGPAATVDHVIPVSKGGPSTFENCVAACRSCNAIKADQLLAELAWTLLVTPRPPSPTWHARLRESDDLLPSWAQFLPDA